MRRTVLLPLLLLAGCASTPAGSPSPAVPTFDPATSCSGSGAPQGATQHQGWPPEATFELLPIPVTSEAAVGPNRFLLNLLDAGNEPVGSPERAVEMRFYDLAKDASRPAITSAGTYMTITSNLPGIYRTTVDFPCWGEWGLEAVMSEPDGSQRIGRMIFSVRPTSSTPAIGAPAPASETPTAQSADEIAAISTDDDPDPDFYSTSIDQALAEHRPALVIFATPAFCRTATCGPALDIVKDAAAELKDEVAFIHVEPYELKLVNGHAELALTEQNQPIIVPSVTEWGLPTEPYIFVVDAGGLVTAKLEGVAAADEIEAALAEVTR